MPVLKAGSLSAKGIEMAFQMLRDFATQGPTQFPNFELTRLMNSLSPTILIS